MTGRRGAVPYRDLFVSVTGVRFAVTVLKGRRGRRPLQILAFVSAIGVRHNLCLPPGGRGTTEWWKESALRTVFADKR